MFLKVYTEDYYTKHEHDQDVFQTIKNLFPTIENKFV